MLLVFLKLYKRNLVLQNIQNNDIHVCMYTQQKHFQGMPVYSQSKEACPGDRYEFLTGIEPG